MKYDNHLKSAIQILDDYDGSFPLSFFLKKFFGQHKQMGSRDRKNISSLAYNYFRLGHAWKNQSRETKIVAATFLCNNISNDFLHYFQPGWDEFISEPLQNKIQFLSNIVTPLDVAQIFPWENLLSDGINHTEFCLSFLQQPHLFIRIRKGKLKEILALLQKNNIAYTACNNTCLALPNGTDIEKIIEDKSWYSVQDYSSQQTAHYFNPAQLSTNNQQPFVWDCCAGSGGKSILLHDSYPRVKLFVSDIRSSILNNLKQRFKEAGIKNYEMAVLDLTKNIQRQMKNYLFDEIIVDAPCSGSGTWARTPEQLYFFNPENIAVFHQWQLQITENVIKYLKLNSPLIYITCSVFKSENEAIINALELTGRETEKKEIIKGYDKGADTMFAARIIKEK